MDQEERPGDQQRRFSQNHHRQDKHVSEVKALARKENGIFAQRMFRTSQIFMARKEKALEVPKEYIIEREHRVNEEHVDVLEPVPWRSGFIRGKAKDATSRKRVVFTVKIDAGVVTPMMEDSPHVRTHSAQIKDVVQGFVDVRSRRDGVVIAIVGNVQQEECLREAA